MNLLSKYFLKPVTLFTCMLSCASAPIMATQCNCKFNLFEGLLSGLWPLVNHDYRNSRANPLEFKINRQNVGTLVREWNFQIPTGAGVSSQPTYANGIAYIGDSSGTVYAIDVSTGTEIWSSVVPNQKFFTTPTVSEDRLYIAGTELHALNKNTGAVIWSTPLYEPGKFANDYPGNTTVVDGLVIIGVGSFVFDQKTQGRLMGYDKDTGEKKWTFATTSDQFADNPQYGPGVGIWSCAAIDRVRKLAFIGTGQTLAGNPSPYTDSILAVNYCTGELAWSYSFNPNDVWNPGAVPQPPLGTFNQDVSVPPVLFSSWTPRLGFVDLVGVASKSGQFKIFKRDQSSPTNVQPLVDLKLDPGSDLGAIQGSPVVYDGVLYIASAAYLTPTGERRTLDELFIAGISPPLQLFAAIQQASLKTIAFDIRKLLQAGNTNGVVPEEAIIWQNTTNGLELTNPLAFANGVLYQTSFNGFLRALDKDTGAELWRTIPIPPTPTFPLPGFLSSGVTIVNGKVLLSYGFDPDGALTTQGGVFSYTLPDTTFHIEDELDL